MKVRDGWCTPKWLADIINLWEPDLDPCSNDRSHINAAISLSSDGFVSTCPYDRVYVNPPYSRGEVIRWVRHYVDADFVFLLRWAPDTGWFAELWPNCWGAWFPYERINFEPPPGVKSSSNPFPHALYFRSQPTGRLLDALLARGYFVRNGGLQQSDGKGGADCDDEGDSGGPRERVPCPCECEGRGPCTYCKISQRLVEYYQAVYARHPAGPKGPGDEG